MESVKWQFVQRLTAWLIASIMSVPALAEEVTGSGDGVVKAVPDSWFIYSVIILVLIGSLITLLVIRSALGDSRWSIADALSEEVEITATRTDDKGVSTVIYDDAGKPAMVTELRASSSRVIAFMGMIVILLMFLGFGSFALYYFAKTGKMPDSIDKVVNYLMAGLTLFAPYIVNKFSSIFESLAPKKS